MKQISSWTYWLVVLVAIASVFVGARLFFQQLYLWEIFLGSGLAYLNHYVGWQLKRRSLGKDTHQFFMYTLGFHGIKLFILLSLFLLIFTTNVLSEGPFIYSFFVVYVIFLIYDIFRLQQWPMTSQ